MQKAAQLIAFFIGGLFAAFCVPVYAQSSSILVVGQGQLYATSTLGTNGAAITATYFLGNGFVGSTTGAVLDFKMSSNPSQNPTANAAIEQFSDSAYTNEVGSCSYQTNISGDNDGLVQLSFSSATGVGCNISSSNYLEIALGYSGNTPPNLNYVYGATFIPHSWVSCMPAASNPACLSSHQNQFYPYFSFEGNGFTLTATSSASALDLSGAQAFCNSEFGTSSSIASDFGSAVCTAVGFLFIPTQSSISQFAELSTGLQQKAPFSWVFQTISTWNSLSATTTQNIPEYSINLAATGIGSTTALGNILPGQMDLLSSSTINKYLPSGVHDSLFALAGFAIDLTAVGYMFRRVMGLFVLES